MKKIISFVVALASLSLVACDGRTLTMPEPVNGQDGVDGARGAMGPQGPAGVVGKITVRKSEPVPVEFGYAGVALAQCDLETERPLSGGCIWGNPDTDEPDTAGTVIPSESYPLAGDDEELIGWRCVGRNVRQHPQAIQAFVTCVDAE